jgi:hypothetical protein
MTEPLSELTEACRRAPVESDDDAIARGGSTWFRGVAAHAEGTVALGMGDVRIIIRERGVRAVTKVDDRYAVKVSSEANVLSRIEKPSRRSSSPTVDAATVTSERPPRDAVPQTGN